MCLCIWIWFQKKSSRDRINFCFVHSWCWIERNFSVYFSFSRINCCCSMISAVGWDIHSSLPWAEATSPSFILPFGHGHEFVSSSRAGNKMSCCCSVPLTHWAALAGCVPTRSGAMSTSVPSVHYSPPTSLSFLWCILLAEDESLRSRPKQATAQKRLKLLSLCH